MTSWLAYEYDMPYLFIHFGGLEASVSESKNIVKKIVGLGEDRIAEVMNELMSNEQVSNVISKAMTRTQRYKHMLDKNVEMALSMLNQPTREDFDKLRKHIRNLDRQIEELDERVTQLVEAASSRKKHKAEE